MRGSQDLSKPVTVELTESLPKGTIFNGVENTLFEVTSVLGEGQGILVKRIGKQWVYFANVASTLDGRSVYLSRKALGEELARLETVPIDRTRSWSPCPTPARRPPTPWPTKLKIPCVEGLIRNRYSGRTFIEGGDSRKRKAETKYTPLREVLEGKRVLLVEDSIVRSTTMKVLLERIRQLGQPREIHVRVACPPIISPCFYGIDMSTIE